jgi:hypothetical protein
MVLLGGKMILSCVQGKTVLQDSDKYILFQCRCKIVESPQHFKQKLLKVPNILNRCELKVAQSCFLISADWQKALDKRKEAYDLSSVDTETSDVDGLRHSKRRKT